MTLFHHKKSGFTLVEMIVSLGIFAVVAVVALGALVKIISANRKAQAIQSAFTNLNFALEAMSRELRVGTNYHCDFTTGDYSDTPTFQACPINNNAVGKPYNTNANPVSIIVFESAKEVLAYDNVTKCRAIYAYRFVTDSSGTLRLQKAEQPRCDTSISPPNDNNPDSLGDFSDVLATKNITLQNYSLGVIKDSGDLYPRVFIRLIGYAGDREREKTFFDVQTTVSQRVLDTAI